MIIKKEMVAMLLAGGAGNRLYVLTKERAKPAVPFGGKYKIIDFPISNCVNSSVDTVGVLTQYQPLELNAYIGNGQPWGLDRMYGGVHILPPYLAGKTGHWYKGTANAIYQNLHFLEQYDPEYVLILSGDHIYKMDYARMLEYHKAKEADLTIAVLNVGYEEASRFGILNTNEDLSVYEFEEKPEKPKSTNASMGIYIFNYKKLKQYLISDEQNEKSSNDFGNDIIPAMLNDECSIFAYPFDGYWKDVGTIDSLWEANMDFLNPKLPLNLSDPLWRIYSRHTATTPHYIGDNTKIRNSIIAAACEIYGNVNYSVLFSGTIVSEDTDIEYSVVMPNVRIGKNCKIKYAIIADDAVIEDGAIIGKAPEECKDEEWGIAVIGRGAVIKAGQVVQPKEIV
jgi:glucose-1-phosphate adenylyltransferase